MTDLRREAWGPEGDVSRRLALEVLRAALIALPAAPTATEGGGVALLVKRHPDGTRTTHDDATLSVEDGLVGDGWSRRAPRDVEAQVEVTSKPHNGCSKYKARFGADALALVQDPATRSQNLRGIHWRVVTSGRVWVGAPIVVFKSAPRATA